MFKFLVLLIILASCSTTKKQQIVEKKDYSFSPIEVSVKVGEVKSVSIPLTEMFDKGDLICKGEQVPFYKSEESLHFFIRETYFSKKEGYSCIWKLSDQKVITLLNVSISSKKFPSERLMVDKKRVTLSKPDLARVVKEQKRLNKIYANYYSEPYFSKPFSLPINNIVTSIYGSKRLFNNHKQGQHLGTDFRAKVGEPIRVTNKGKVVLAGDLFFTGGTVIVDHGLGIFTVYGHLSKIQVSEGDMVMDLDVIGLSGVSGRVTGPHLHWGVKVQGQWIDGMSLISYSQFLAKP